MLPGWAFVNVPCTRLMPASHCTQAAVCLGCGPGNGVAGSQSMGGPPSGDKGLFSRVVTPGQNVEM